MSIKTILIICAQVLFIQSISAACLGGCGGLAYDGCGCGGLGYGGYDYGGLDFGGYDYGRIGYGGFGFDGFGAGAVSASNGPSLAVVSASPMIHAGVSVLSENAYAGELAAGGALPFLGTVAVEGALPTAGAGAIRYGCGNGAVGIAAEDGYAGFGYGGLAGPLGYRYGLAGPLGYEGYGGYGGCGCGLGALYQKPID